MINLSRREFLGSAFAAGVCGCAMSKCGCSLPRVAVQLYSVRGIIKEKGLPFVLAELKKLGYAGVEFAGYYGKSSKELKAMLDDNGLVACGTHIGAQTLMPENIAKTIEFELGYGNTHLVCPGMGPDKNFTGDLAKWWRGMADKFAAAADTAAKSGCTVGYPNHQHEFKPRLMLDGKETCKWEILFSNTPNSVQMEMDVGWCVTAGEDPEYWFNRYPHRSISIHAKEVFAKGAPGILGQPGVLENGSPRKGVDWDKLFKVTDADGVKWYVVECETNPNSFESVAASIAFLKAKGRC